MFRNTGKKIKEIARIYCIIGFLAFILWGIIAVVMGFLQTNAIWVGVGLFLIIWGPLSSWITALFLYGFGKLVENSDKLVMLEKEKKNGLIETSNHANNQALTHYEIDNGTQRINNNAFSNCKNLSSIVICRSIVEIGDFAFSECVNLKRIYYMGNIPKWASIKIGAGNELLKNATVY